MNENKRGVTECPFDSSLDSQGQRTSAGPVGEGGGRRGRVLSAVPMIFITTRQCICGKVMFSYVSVCPPSNMGARGPPWPWPLQTRDPLLSDMGPQGPYSSSPTLVTSDAHHWRPVETCSLKDLPLPPDLYFNRPPTKLRECNVYTGVSQSFCPGGGVSMIPSPFRGGG